MKPSSLAAESGWIFGEASTPARRTPETSRYAGRAAFNGVAESPSHGHSGRFALNPSQTIDSDER